MKLSINYFKALSGKAYASVLMALFFISEVAEARGLSKGKTIIKILKEEILFMVSSVAALALILLGFAYMKGMVSKDNFWKWGIGLLIVICADPLVTALNI